jgi:hypothetical protein
MSLGAASPSIALVGGLLPPEEASMPAFRPATASAALRAVPLLLALAEPQSACRGPAPTGDLGRAAASGDVRRLATLLRKVTPDAPEDQLGALAWAARYGQAASATVLLDAGADPNQRDRRRGWTPLLHALHAHQPEVARLLLARGADPRVRASNAVPVSVAALRGYLPLVRAMLGSDLPREHRQRALDVAISGGALADPRAKLFGACRADVVRVLLEHDPTLGVDASGRPFTPLWWARWQGCSDTMALVERAARPER